MEWDIFHLYTTAPQSLPVFHQYLRNCVTYKYVIYHEKGLLTVLLLMFVT